MVGYDGEQKECCDTRPATTHNVRRQRTQITASTAMAPTTGPKTGRLTIAPSYWPGSSTTSLAYLALKHHRCYRPREMESKRAKSATWRDVDNTALRPWATRVYAYAALRNASVRKMTRNATATSEHHSPPVTQPGMVLPCRQEESRDDEEGVSETLGCRHYPRLAMRLCQQWAIDDSPVSQHRDHEANMAR